MTKKSLRITVFILLLICTMVLSACGSIVTDKTVPNPVIDFKYDFLTTYSSNFFIATLNKRYAAFALQNGTYQQVTTFGQYDSYSLSTGKTLLVRKGNKYGLIGTNGKLVVDTTYDSLRCSPGTNTYVGRNKAGSVVFDGNGQKIYSTPDDIREVHKTTSGAYQFIVSRQNQLGIFDIKANLIVPQKYSSLSYVGDNYIIARDKNGNYGVLDQNAKTVIPFNYKSITAQYSGLNGLNPGPIQLFFHARKPDGYILLDTNGQQVLQSGNYDEVLSVDDFFEVEKNNKWGLVDKANNIKLPLIYDLGIVFQEINGQKYIEVLQNGKVGILNQNFEFIVPCGTYDQMWMPRGINLLEVKKNGKYGFIDTSGKIAIPIIYDNVSLIGDSGLIAVKKGDKFGFINDKNQVILPIEYDYVNQFSNGVALVVKDGKCGYIDTKGKLVVPLIYDFNGQQTKVIGLTDAYLIDDTYGKNLVLPVNKDGKWGAIKILQPINLSD